jgi:hypothetical protein
MIDYYESAEDTTITKDRALQELRDHNCEDFTEFFEDLGDREYYNAQIVLQWLGY